jgi:hypothetical protein
LRALYLLWSCAAYDESNDPKAMIEPPVPHGVAGIATHCSELLTFFGLDPLLLVAAGMDVETAHADESMDRAVARWVKELNTQRAKDLLLQLLSGDAAVVKAGLLSEIRSSRTLEGWPTSDKKRSLAELLQATETLRSGADAKQARKDQTKAKRDAAKADRDRASRLTEMAESPDKWLRDAEKSVGFGGTHNYKAAAEILHDLREAIGGDEGDKVARRCAASLVKAHPTRSHLKSSLRKRGLLES